MTTTPWLGTSSLISTGLLSYWSSQKVREQHAPQKDLLTRSTDSFTSLPPELRLKVRA